MFAELVPVSWTSGDVLETIRDSALMTALIVWVTICLAFVWCSYTRAPSWPVLYTGIPATIGLMLTVGLADEARPGSAMADVLYVVAAPTTLVLCLFGVSLIKVGAAGLDLDRADPPIDDDAMPTGAWPS